jgi:hypothetical protein
MVTIHGYRDGTSRIRKAVITPLIKCLNCVLEIMCAGTLRKPRFPTVSYSDRNGVVTVDLTVVDVGYVALRYFYISGVTYFSFGCNHDNSRCGSWSDQCLKPLKVLELIEVVG